MLIQSVLQEIKCTLKCKGLRRRLRKRLGVGLSVNDQHNVLPCADEDVSGPRPSREIIIQQFLKRHLLYHLIPFLNLYTYSTYLLDSDYGRHGGQPSTVRGSVFWRDDLRVVRCEIQIEQVEPQPLRPLRSPLLRSLR